MINPESTLRSEYDNAKILDFRDPSNPNNDIVLTCEHAFNDLPEEYSWSDSDTRYFKNEHWGLDLGAFDMARALAAELKCVLVHSLYSRLLLDTNRSIVSDTLFRKSGDGQEVDLNKDMTFEEEQKRIKKYFIPYYEALREISTKVDPKYIFSIHSFTPLYQGEPRAVEIGVLYGPDSSDLAEKIHNGSAGKYKSELNKPYDGTTTMGTVKSLIFAKFPAKRQGLTYEFRNDLLQNPARFDELRDLTVDTIRKVCCP